MKTYMSVLLAIALVLSLGTVAMADLAAGTGIKGTSHDLSMTGGNTGANRFSDDAGATGKDRICIYCHAPHNTAKELVDASMDFDYLPLWNHTNTTLAGSYTLYSNGWYEPGLEDHRINANDFLATGQPGGVSLLCLSCHDGSVGVNQYGWYNNQSSHNAGVAEPMDGRALIGSLGDLTNHHPIGFNYDDVANVDHEIRLSSVLIPAQPTYAGGVKPEGPVYIADLLSTDGMFECVSCHDVHNTKNGGNKFTWVDDTNSNFCFTCHVKDNSDQTMDYTY